MTDFFDCRHEPPKPTCRLCFLAGRLPPAEAKPRLSVAELAARKRH